MVRSLEVRLAKLEAQVVSPTTDLWEPPTFSDAWVEEVLSLLDQYGYLESVLRSLPMCPYEETLP
jgi:hypothetical protein